MGEWMLFKPAIWREPFSMYSTYLYCRLLVV